MCVHDLVSFSFVVSDDCWRWGIETEREMLIMTRWGRKTRWASTTASGSLEVRERCSGKKGFCNPVRYGGSLLLYFTRMDPQMRRRTYIRTYTERRLLGCCKRIYVSECFGKLSALSRVLYGTAVQPCHFMRMDPKITRRGRT